MAKGPIFPAFSRDAPAAAIAAEVLSALHGDVQAHAPSAVAGDDEEAVHGMRVALRRLRTLFDCFEPSFRRKPFAKMRKQLRALARKLGNVRDADVHLASLRAYRTGSTLREAAGVDWLIARLRAQRSADLVRLHETYTRFSRRFDGAFGSAACTDPTALGPSLQHLIETGLAKHVRHGKRAFVLGDRERLHRFRISGKRLRYVLEVFASTLGEHSYEPQKSLGDMQDDLGLINDANTFSALYAQLIETMPSRDARRFGLYGLITARTEARNRALESARARWEGAGRRPYSAALCEPLHMALHAN